MLQHRLSDSSGTELDTSECSTSKVVNRARNGTTTNYEKVDNKPLFKSKYNVAVYQTIAAGYQTL
jgi:hypothetical protein